MENRVQRALLVANHHPEARPGDPGHHLEREEEIRQLGLLLLHCQPPWVVRGLWGRDGDDRSHVGAQVRQALDGILTGTPDMVFVALSGHALLRRDGPALLPRDVPLSLAGEGALPLGWIRERLGESAARHLVVCADLLPMEGDIGAAADLAACLRLPDRDMTIITRRRAVPGEPSLINAIIAAFHGAAYDPSVGAVTVRRLIEHLQSSAGRGPASSLHAESTADAALELLTPPAPGNVELFLPTRPVARSPRNFTPGDAEAETVLLRTVGPGDYLPGKLRLIRRIGEGGFGAVYEGEQVALARRVAVKVLRSDASRDPEVMTMFSREMQAIAALDSPNVVRILAADKAPVTGELFYAMELLKGQTLRGALLQHGRLTHARAAGLIRDILFGLSAAHEKGIIHRDVKPENIMIEPEPGGAERAVLLDFGVSRILRMARPGSGVTVVGTPGYIAPEVLAGHRVDQRADIYSAGVVLYEMLTGARPTTTEREELRRELVSRKIPDGTIRTVLNALEMEPRRRFMSAQLFSDALTGVPMASDRRETAVATPFKFFSPFDEEDAAYYFGRDRVITEILETVLFGRSLVLTGPSGTGKSSMIHAGLLPALRRAGAQPVVIPCRGDPLKELVERLITDAPSVKEYAPPTGRHGPPAMRLEEACYKAHRDTGKPLVLILDQAERLFIEGGVDRDRRRDLEEALVTISSTDSTYVSVLLSIREDFLAHLAPLRRAMGLSARQEVRLGPLGRDACALALVEPLRAREITIADDLLAVLLDDLARACREMHIWQETEARDAVYPPHLQMAASILYETLGAEERTVTIEHYHRAGGLRGILEQHLKYVLDRYLEPDAARVAHTVAQSLVSPARTRLAVPEAVVRSRALRDNAPAALETALEVLVDLRIIQPVNIRSVRNLELVHDCLVDPILAWTDKTDLQRRSAKESMRVRLFRSQPDRIQHLDRDELRDIRRFPDVVADLDEELEHLGEGVRPPLSARQLVDRSARRLRLRRGAWLGATLLVLALVVGATLYRMYDLSLQAGNVGRFYVRWQLVEEGPDGGLVGIPRDQFPDLNWALYAPGDPERNPVGPPIPADHFSRAVVAEGDDGSWTEHVTASGGRRVLVVTGRHRVGEPPCGPSVIQIDDLPGYGAREDTDDPAEALTLRIPTCRETRAGTVEVPGGRFWMGTERENWRPGIDNRPHGVALSTYAMDRTEVSSRDYMDYVEALRPFLSRTTRDDLYLDPGELDAATAAHLMVEPMMEVSWDDARRYCLWMGKDLPTDAQWVKAGRGGIWLDGDAQRTRRNPAPMRLFPWGDDEELLPKRAMCMLTWSPGEEQGAPSQLYVYQDVESLEEGASPYGVLHLSGNVLEWIRDFRAPPPDEVDPEQVLKDPVGPDSGIQRRVRGGYSFSRTAPYCSLAYPDWIGPVNQRRGLGFRCAAHGPATAWVNLP
ncbi:MAG: SUMF1/EgtB/PvdO family nonheme iron enzyme [Pseudomonadota bacterium]